MLFYLFFFFNDTATTEIYTLSLHDALPISGVAEDRADRGGAQLGTVQDLAGQSLEVDDEADVRSVAALCVGVDRKSTRLNSSHANISYAVFCLKKKKKTYISN